MRVAAFAFAFSVLPALAAPPRGCVAGAVDVGTFQVMVQSGTGAAKPVAHLNTIKQGYKVTYKPVTLPADLKKEARVALVLAPADGEPTGTTPLTLLELYPANAPAEWTIPSRVGVLSLIFGPQGLDEKKVANIVARDEDLIAQLADYADQTAQLESTIQALLTLEENPEQSDEEVASHLGDTPVEQALLALLRAQNPSLSTYNPLAAGRRAPPATLMGKATEGFFDNAGGIVPGGGVLPGIKGYLFPDTELRSTFARRTDTGELTLCGKRRAPRSRTKVAYLWAHRVPNTAAPAARLAATAHVVAGERALLPVKPATASAWESLERVRSWELQPKQGGAAAGGGVQVSEPARSFWLDLRKTRIAPGTYRLTGKWDWEDYNLEGDIEIHAAPDLAKAKLDPSSQSRLVVDSGVVAVKISGVDFEFLEKAALGGPKAVPVAFHLPNGKRARPQDSVTVDIDTDSLRPGSYEMELNQAGGGAGKVPFRILPPHPKITVEPVRLNIGEAQQTVTLRGSDLARIERLESDQADVQLAPAAGEERKATVRLRPGAKVGEPLALRMKVESVDQPLAVDARWTVAGPRPRLKLTKTSLPEDPGVALRAGELPAGSFSGFLLETENAADNATLRLACEGRAQGTTLFLGQRLNSATLEKIGPARWYLSADPGSVGGAGCTLAASVETAAGRSDPASLGHVTRLPRIESMDLAADKVAIKGQSLETVEKVGWDSASPQPVAGLPVPLAGEGARQVLRTPLAAPAAPAATLVVWLWGEAEPRATIASLPKPPEVKPSPAPGEVKPPDVKPGEVKPPQ